MATKIDVKPLVYSVRIQGLIACTEERRRVERAYDITVRMTQEMVQAGALSSWKNAIAPTIMPRAFPGFKKLVVSEIVDAARSDGEGISELQLMSLPALVQYVDLAKLPIDTILYEDRGQLEEAIKLYRDTPDAYMKYEKNKRAKIGDSIKHRIDAQTLNQDVEIHEPGAKLLPAQAETKVTVPETPKLPASNSSGRPRGSKGAKSAKSAKGKAAVGKTAAERI